jgi:lipopolysaccharide transport system ATP-binding protein
MFHTSDNSNPSNLVLDVDHVWKIYCRNLQRAMRYGIRDLGREVFGTGHDRAQEDLRPGEFFAVRDAHFQVEPGECVAMIGPNGAGKSTMLKMINGLIKPDAGQVQIRGKIGALIELGTGFNPILSGKENIYINAAVLGMPKREVDLLFDEIVDFAELGHVINDPIKTYSSGMRVRLGFSIAANLRPQLLLMDEVLAVGDVGFRMKCFKHLRTLVKNGVSIILVTHAVGMLQRVATRSIVFGKGKIIHDGELETGCTIYEEMLGASDRVRERQHDSKDQMARIEQIEIVNEHGQPQKEFDTGQTVKLQIKLTCRQPIKNARLVVALCSPVHGVISSMSTVYHGVKFSLDPKIDPDGKTVTLKFDDIRLLIGAYHFNISLYGPETTAFFHRVSGCGTFRIVGPSVNASGRGINGMFKLDHQWDMR